MAALKTRANPWARQQVAAVVVAAKKLGRPRPIMRSLETTVEQLMRQGKSLACRWQAAAARHEEAAAVATPKRLPPSPLAKRWVAAVAKRRLERSRPIVRVLLEAMSDHQLL